MLKPLMPNVIVFEDKEYKVVVKVKCHKDETLIQQDLRLFKKTHQGACSLSLFLSLSLISPSLSPPSLAHGSYERTERWWPPTSQEEKPHQEQTMLTP